jgi:hypothetical protein
VHALHAPLLVLLYISYTKLQGWPRDRDRKRSVRQFLQLVPLMVLVRASMRTRAYTRALQYLEQHIRDVRADVAADVSNTSSAGIHICTILFI